MAISKKRKSVASKVDKNKAYTLNDASSLVREVNIAKFDASVDLHIRLGVDPKKSRSVSTRNRKSATWNRKNQTRSGTLYP